MTKKELFDTISEKEEMYFRLVWYARRRPENMQIPGVAEATAEVETKWPKEVKAFIEDETGYWQHGFNSGMLACLRYINTLEKFGKEQADEEFPELSS